MQIENHNMMPGDLLEYRCPEFGVVFQWRVFGIYLGASGQESLVEVGPVHQKPGTDSLNREHARMMVPEPMTRSLTVFRPGLRDAQ